jgi:hypothetical protein
MPKTFQTKPKPIEFIKLSIASLFDGDVALINLERLRHRIFRWWHQRCNNHLTTTDDGVASTRPSGLIQGLISDPMPLTKISAQTGIFCTMILGVSPSGCFGTSMDYSGRGSGNEVNLYGNLGS